MIDGTHIIQMEQEFGGRHSKITMAPVIKPFDHLPQTWANEGINRVGLMKELYMTRPHGTPATNYVDAIFPMVGHSEWMDAPGVYK